MKSHPRIKLKIQPMVDLLDISDENVDLAIRWGDGSWKDTRIECLFTCPAFVTGASGTAQMIEQNGFENLTLLNDREGSSAWEEWHAKAELPFTTKTDALIIPDPNVRVQAVIDGQGLAFNDALIAPELEYGQLEKVHKTGLENYGYFLAYLPNSKSNTAAIEFADWLLLQGRSFNPD